jgi:hypothetical protein
MTDEHAPTTQVRVARDWMDRLHEINRRRRGGGEPPLIARMLAEDGFKRMLPDEEQRLGIKPTEQNNPPTE